MSTCQSSERSADSKAKAGVQEEDGPPEDKATQCTGSKLCLCGSVEMQMPTPRISACVPRMLTQLEPPWQELGHEFRILGDAELSRQSLLRTAFP